MEAGLAAANPLNLETVIGKESGDPVTKILWGQTNKTQKDK